MLVNSIFPETYQCRQYWDAHGKELFTSISYTFLVNTSFFLKDAHLSCCKQHFRLKSGMSDKVLDRISAWPTPIRTAMPYTVIFKNPQPLAPQNSRLPSLRGCGKVSYALESRKACGLNFCTSGCLWQAKIPVKMSTMANAIDTNTCTEGVNPPHMLNGRKEVFVSGVWCKAGRTQRGLIDWEGRKWGGCLSRRISWIREELSHLVGCLKLSSPS